MSAAEGLRNELAVLPMLERRREALFALLDAALEEARAAAAAEMPATEALERAWSGWLLSHGTPDGYRTLIHRAFDAGWEARAAAAAEVTTLREALASARERLDLGNRAMLDAEYPIAAAPTPTVREAPVGLDVGPYEREDGKWSLHDPEPPVPSDPVPSDEGER